MPEKPTSLHLFNFREPQIAPLAARFDGARALNSHGHSAMAAQIRLAGSTTAKVNRLIEQMDSTTDDNTLISSSVVTGNMYLRMYDELHVGRGLSSQDFMDFFKMAVSTSAEYFDPLIRDVTTKGWQHVKSNNQAKGASAVRVDVLKKGLRRAYGSTNLPGWFKGNFSDWANFVPYHAYSDKYLSPLSD